MSTPPSETEYHDVTLSREEEWVVHHSLVHRVDDALDEDSSPPSWTLSLVETVESNDDTEQFTTAQIRRLTTLLTEYVDREETPARDVEHGRAAIDRLDGVLESRG
ncbi:uncharacterized protein Nmag_2724 [Natrialba magadii ATCC 43099]|uniref:Uncharacterized protein n=1 Tax=Natrialba magadii (strain ATCC 43099 / DSM 3394 / CCM 3739 / CIP 104546 / IAM 13178 / JCM 8861 / NBRC 102185 / NCIMB 2190 / MS3) TaxID=547559 RepID=D3SZM0_NATMM|nr:hypothetical protein [Natrialba magadii]ADD06280.1 uncharacterized protein Nmag_2724 [Natrialba magadii ATCC 43099]ELY31284.1 hypothetical protein C500_06771 [Natrialba magadii ATCC 43099]